MVDPTKALATVPSGLRDPLLAEYRNIGQNYMEGRWSSSELSGGKFSEIVYTILDGYANGKYSDRPSKPHDFVAACRKLEGYSHVPRSFQILIPRLLPALYEIRNNRGVGHTGGDVDPNHMDAMVVMSMCNWVVAELVRVVHGLSVAEAQVLVTNLTERNVPLVWNGEGVKRVLDPSLPRKDQLLLLIASSGSKVETGALREWAACENSYFWKVLAKLHSDRMVEVSKDRSTVEVLPPGSKYVAELMVKHTQSAV